MQCIETKLISQSGNIKGVGGVGESDIQSLFCAVDDFHLTAPSPSVIIVFPSVVIVLSVAWGLGVSDRRAGHQPKPNHSRVNNVQRTVMHCPKNGNTRATMFEWETHRDSLEKVDDDALRGATLAAYFPDGLKFSQLQLQCDSAYFREHEDEQGSSSSSDSNSDSDSDSGSIISSTDDDSSSGDFDAPESARHADGGAESDVSSLTSAEGLPNAPTTDDDSDLNSDTEVAWVRSACGVWGMGHSFGNKLYFTRDIPEGKWVPKNLLAPAKRPTKKAKPPPKSAAQSIPV